MPTAHQEALSVVAPIKAGEVAAVKSILGTITDHVDDWIVIPFARLANLHFARVVVLDESTDFEGNRLPAQLALLTNIDAPLDAHLSELARLGAAGLDGLFGRCEGYPDSSHRTPDTRALFLRQHHVRSKAFYVNRQGRTVDQIRQEEQLRHAINDYLDSADFSGEAPERVRAAIVDFVRHRPDLRWALEPVGAHRLGWRIRELADRIGRPALVLVFAPILLLLLPFLVILLRRHEKRDSPDSSRAPAEDIRRFRADEDFWVQNQIIAAGLFKRGLFRRFLANAILATTNYAVRHIYNRGSLSGLNTIHFARWTPLDGGQRMFFSSNYDGSLESYMNDFIDKAAWGLNAIFSNGDGFPRTSFLVCGGITDEKAYKRFLPTRQVQTRVWYSAYPHLSTKNIANNAAIRQGLSGQLGAEETKAWLARFGVAGNLPESGLIARFLDGFPWEKVCRRCS